LLSQVRGRTNLVLYDWETTGQAVVATNPPGGRGPARATNQIGRLIHFKHLLQFLMMSTSTRPNLLPSTEAGTIAVPGGAWIDAAAPRLGNTVTEVTRTGPAELSVVRQSQVGFSSLELVHLLRWIGNPGFPGWQDVPPPEVDRRRPASPPPAAGSGAALPSPAPSPAPRAGTAATKP